MMQVAPSLMQFAFSFFSERNDPREKNAASLTSRLLEQDNDRFFAHYWTHKELLWRQPVLLLPVLASMSRAVESLHCGPVKERRSFCVACIP